MKKKKENLDQDTNAANDFYYCPLCSRQLKKGERCQDHPEQIPLDEKRWKEQQAIINKNIGGDAGFPIACKLSELSAKYVDKPVRIKCQITGENLQKGLPSYVELYCKKCDSETKLYTQKKPDVAFRLINHKSKYFEDRCMDCTRKIWGQLSKEYVDLHILLVRDLKDESERFNPVKHQSKRVFVIGEEIPTGRNIEIYGIVVVEPKLKDISIIVTKILPLESEVEKFEITDKDKKLWPLYFKRDAQIWKQIAPDIVGEKRVLAKKAATLILHSPHSIPTLDGDRIQRGGLRGLHIGDTKTAKSFISRDITNKGEYPLGEYVVCETGSRTGILYSIDTENDAIIWGNLPLNDRRLVVLDGMQAMTPEEMGEFRESLEQEEVIVNRSQKGSAPARVRLLACMNPNKPMKEYIYQCEAIKDSWVFKNQPDITRFDIFIPFADEDVSADDIAQRTVQERPIPNDVFLRHIYWVWSRKPEQIKITSEAKECIKDSTAMLFKQFKISQLPIIHSGQREVLIRLSAAFAAMYHSVDDSHETIIVREEHAQDAVGFVEEMLEHLQLLKYVNVVRGREELNESEVLQLAEKLEARDYQILKVIVRNPVSSEVLAEQMGVSSRTIKKHYTTLKSLLLITTKQGVGAVATSRGIQFLKFLETGGTPKLDEIVKERFTNEKDSEVKLHDFIKKKGAPPNHFSESDGRGGGEVP